MNPLNPSRPSRPLSTSETISSSKATQSASHRRSIPTLNKLSAVTPSPSTEIDIDYSSSASGYTAKTLRFVSRGSKEVLRRSGLGGLFLGEESRPTSHTVSSSKSRSATLDTSTILYPTLHSHPDPVEHPILLLDLKAIDGISPMINNDELFDILLRRLEPWVGEEGNGGYVLIVLAADDGEMGGRTWPGVGWWVWKWKSIPRKYRKNMKRLYIVHPSLFTRTLLPFLLPLLSPKSYGKLHPLPSLLSLAHTYHVSLSGVQVTLPVLHEEARLLRDRPDLIPTRTRSNRSPIKSDQGGSWGSTISSSIGYATSYLSFSRTTSRVSETAEEVVRKGFWGRPAGDVLAETEGKVPKFLVSLGEAILAHCTDTEGVFRRTSNSALLGPMIALLDLPILKQPNLPWSEIAREDPLLPPKILLRFLSDLDQPLIPQSTYSSIRNCTTVDDVHQVLIPELPPPAKTILEHIIHVMAELSAYESSTKMSPLALSIVLAPTLINGGDPVEDAEMCLSPGKTLPLGLRKVQPDGSEEVGKGGTLVGVLEMWMEEIAEKSG